MIRATIDTNTLVSAIANKSTSVNRQVWQAWHDKQFTLVVSEYILAELQRTLLKPYFANILSLEMVLGAVSLLRQEAIITPLHTEVSGIATQKKDDPILSTAVSGKVDYLVTRDKPLLRAIPEYQGIKLVSPPEFLEVLRVQET